MPSDIMKKVLDAETACDEKRAKAKEEAAAVIAEAEKKAAAMLREAEGFARAKSKTVISKAEAEAEIKVSAGGSETRSEIASIKAAANEKYSDAVRQIALSLLQLS